ncbi:hypothetical protein D3C79_862180 [compost metagenome]
MAAGAVVFRGVDPANAVEHLTGGSGALTFEFFATDDIAGTGMLEDIVLFSCPQPVADHGRRAQLYRRVGSGCRLQAEGVFTFGTGLQAAALEQDIQCLLRAVLAVQARALHTAGDLGAERDQHAAFPAELVQGAFQRHRRDVVAACCRRVSQGWDGGNAQASAEQECTKGLGKWARAKGHARGP